MTFSYYEHKFLVTDGNLPQVRAVLLSLFGKSDPFPLGVVDSVYFDTLSRLDEMETLLIPVCRKVQIVSTRTYDGITSFVVNIPHLGWEEHSRLVNQLLQWDKDVHVNVFYPTESLTA